jgi:hypothetical protein
MTDKTDKRELDLDAETVEDLEPDEKDEEDVQGGLGKNTAACGGGGGYSRAGGC